MSRSSEPPILAESEAARNCLGLNATVLPGLGTFRIGNRFRGLVEMGMALGGTLFFCLTLFRAMGERDESMTLPQAFAPHAFHLLFGVILVLGSWLSGVLFARGLLRK